MFNTLRSFSIKLLISLGVIGAVLLSEVAPYQRIQAQQLSFPELPLISLPETATSEATPSGASSTATPAATIQQRITERTDQDITERTGRTKEKLVEILESNPLSPLSWHNMLQHAIRQAITNGLPANIVVLLLLFPIITFIISFSRHMIGLKGFGVYTPAVLSVAFVSTGIMNGLVLFFIILASAMIMKRFLKKLNLQYLPRTAMLFWGVSVIMLLTLVGVSSLPSEIPGNIIATLNIFPLLIIMLLTENFMESQLSGSQSEAQQLTIETLIIAIFCSLLIGSETVQKYVILQPELVLILVAMGNMAVGKYSGLRLMEWIRFRSIID